MIDTVSYFLLAFFAVGALLLYRNHFAHVVRQKAIAIYSAEAKRRTDACRLDWAGAWKPYEDGPSHLDIMFNLRVWTFEQAYPNFEKRVQA